MNRPSIPRPLVVLSPPPAPAELESACESPAHRAGIAGHDQGPARFQILSVCPRCSFTHITQLCAGRVVRARKTAPLAQCPECGLRAPTPTFWEEIRPLGDQCAWCGGDGLDPWSGLPDSVCAACNGSGVAE